MNSFPIEESQVYPAEHHFRIIVHAESSAQAGLERVLHDFDVVSPLERSQASQQGRYQSLRVSVRLINRADHVRLDQALRTVAGVRILL